MNATKNQIIIALLAISVIIIGIYAFSGNSGDKMEKDSMTGKTDESAMMDKKDGETMMKDEGAMMDKKEEAMMDGGEAMMKKGSYEAYSPEKLSLASDGKVLLFFHATWCPVCRSIEAEINSNSEAIPAGVHILKVDYDKEITLRQKYGVTVQHTFVQVDSSSNLVQKFNDAAKLSAVLSRIK